MRHAFSLVLFAVVLTSCNDRTRDAPPPRFGAPTEDVGVDVIDFGPPIEPDTICDGELDGASCELPNGRGVCARQRCQLVACEAGFGDCDEMRPGCETSFEDPASCGGCDVVCDESQACERGPTGFACAAGVLCPTDRFDLDSDPANGCEWQSVWEEPYTLVPLDLEIEAAGWGDAPLVAGGNAEERVSVTLGVAPQPTVWPEPRGEARAVDVRRDDVLERVVWTDGVSIRLLEDQSTFFLVPDCDSASARRRFVGATHDFVATQYEVFRVDLACADGPCLQPVFGLADYQAAVFDDLEPDELALCDGCANSLPGGCWGPRQCRPDDFDRAVCADCNPTSCPSFSVVDLVEVDELLGVVTARGVLLVDPQSGLVDRAEASFDPNVAGGPRFVEAIDAPGAVTAFHSTGFVRVLDAELFALHPDIGVEFDPETAPLAGDGEVFVAIVDDTAQLWRPGELSARVAYLDLTTAPGIQGLRPVAATATPDGLRVFYQSAGQLFTRRVFR